MATGSPSDARLHVALLDAVGDAVVAAGPDGRVVFWNAGAERTYGRTAAEMLGRDVGEVPSLERLRTAYPWAGDVTAQRPDGRTTPARLSVRPLRDRGELVAVIGVVTDVTAEATARRLSAIVDSSDDAIIGRDLDGIVRSWNGAAERLVGYSAAEAIGQHATFATPPEKHAAIYDIVARVGRGEVIPPYEQVVLRKDGERRHISLAISAMRDETGRIVGSSAIARDVTQQVRLRRAAEDDRRRLAEAQAIARLGSFEHLLADGTLICSDELYRIAGIEPGTPLHAGTLATMVHPDDLALTRTARDRAAAGEGPVDYTCRLVRPDGDVRYVSVRVHLRHDDSGRRIVGTVLDVTERRRADAERAAAERRFELGFETAAAGTAIADLDGRLVRVNPALCGLLGREAGALVGHRVEDFAHADDRARCGAGASGGEVRFLRPDGRTVEALVDVAVVRNECGEPEYLFAQVLDITGRKHAERALEHQALHDALTGLPNRTLLLDRLDHALLQRDRRGGTVAVLLVDLDHFKLVNDGLGHAAGDALLVDVAARLGTAVRPGDTVCRLGGDEFVVCCENVAGADEALAIAERVNDAFSAPFVLDRSEVFVTASVGVTLANPGTSAQELLRDSDAAMYRAKERGRSRVELFDEVLRQRAAGRLATATALRRALAQGEVVVHYQPVLSVADDRVVGFEALARWEDPERGLVPPNEFIPIAEETGMIVPLGAHVLREATRTLASWSATYPGAAALTVAVNVSARQLADPHLVPTVAEALAESGLAPQRLHLEITETVLMEDVDDSARVLGQLADLGVTLEIDDFGTGYSSLSYLKRFPVDTLKIDRGFVAGLGTDPDDTSIVTAIAALGRALGLRLHAEGVETEQQRRAVREIGCQYAQGYFWSPALPAAEVLPWLRRRAFGAVPDQRGRRLAVGS
jgi:diguanylate cyclase (GGDEF)-like protein/PAS domain S-box-containing protein